MFSLFKYAKKYNKQIYLGAFFKVVEAVFEMCLPIMMAILIDQGIKMNDFNVVMTQGILMFIFSVIGLIAVFKCQYDASIASQGLGTELRNALATKIQKIPLETMQQKSQGDLLTLMSNDINQVQLSLAMMIRLAIRAPFLSLGTIIMVFYISRELAFIFFIIFIIFSIFLFLTIKYALPTYTFVQKRLGTYSMSIKETIVGIRVIRAFAKENQNQQKNDEDSQYLKEMQIESSFKSIWLNPLTILTMNLGIVLIIGVSGLQLFHIQLSSGEVVALVNYMMQMILALIIVSNLVVIFSKGIVSNKRLSDFLQIEEEKQRDKAFVWDDLIHDMIELKDVSFHYTNRSTHMLKDINLRISKHQTIGITGPTGSGKSTLIKLIGGYYIPTTGHVYMNQRDIFDYKQQDIRQHIAYVNQKVMFLSGTIKEQLLLGCKVSDEVLYKALETSMSLEFINQLPNGLETQMNEGSFELSGGQKQRLSIARALLKHPKLLILDDAFSALDFQTDLQIRQRLKTNYPELTCLIISQRLSSIKNADCIYVIENGSIVMKGSHQELIQQDGFYQSMWQLQKETR